MSIKPKHVLFTTLGLLTFGLGWRLFRTGKKLETQVFARLHKADWKLIQIAVDVTIKNPTAGKLSFRTPFVKLLLNGSTLGTSISDNQIHTLEPFSQVQLRELIIEIPVLGLTAAAAGIAQLLTGAIEVLPLGVNVSTTAYTGPVGFPISTTHTVELKKPFGNG